MTCEQCREREAEVHLTQIVNDQVSQLHLCAKCAEERGVESSAPSKTPLGTFLAAMGKGLPAPARSAADAEVCPGCGATLQDFRESGRLGCATCYATFAGPLRELLRRLHGATVHTGKRYVAPGASEEERAMALDQLRAQLQEAIAHEDFERAAELRDKLRVAE